MCICRKCSCQLCVKFVLAAAPGLMPRLHAAKMQMQLRAATWRTWHAAWMASLRACHARESVYIYSSPGQCDSYDCTRGTQKTEQYTYC